mmetsp:Transcript_6841/g.18513  ORF Transcript_6841/g.18513 Transcript_6841/m.18513 type:complete len:124 (-) Transcript_6841:465-836(-)
MQYVIQKEKQEAERKRIEASGVADFQRIVSEGISKETLAWKGIEATQEIATSPNAKIVLVGNTLESLPILLSGDGHDGPDTPHSKALREAKHHSGTSSKSQMHTLDTQQAGVPISTVVSHDSG